MRRCYLHIGTHKTGTSTIQLALAQQPERLAGAGFHFPLTGRLDPDSGQHRLALPAPADTLHALTDSLIDEIRGTPHHVILSSEEFSHMLWRRPAEFQRIVDRLSEVVDEIVVILYLRRQTDYIESNYQERLKSRFCLDFAAYADARLTLDLAEFPLDYTKLLAQLDRITGINTVIRSYESACVPSVLADFLHVIDWPARFELHEERINASTPLIEQLKNFYRAQQQREATPAEERLLELIGQHLPERPHMAAATRNRIVEHFSASNAEVAGRFGLDALREEASLPREFGTWCGLGHAPPPDHDDMAASTLDHLFSRDFISIVEPVADCLGMTQSALEHTQSLARERQHTIDELERRLETTSAVAGAKTAEAGEVADFADPGSSARAKVATAHSPSSWRMRLSSFYRRTAPKT